MTTLGEPQYRSASFSHALKISASLSSSHAFAPHHRPSLASGCDAVWMSSVTMTPAAASLATTSSSTVRVSMFWYSPHIHESVTQLSAATSGAESGSRTRFMSSCTSRATCSSAVNHCRWCGQPSAWKPAQLAPLKKSSTAAAPLISVGWAQMAPE